MVNWSDTCLGFFPFSPTGLTNRGVGRKTERMDALYLFRHSIHSDVEIRYSLCLQ